MPVRRRGPGLAKTARPRFLRGRTVRLWEASDYRWRELFESADVMSEGAARLESRGRVYYGSTSVLLPDVSHGGLLPDEQCTRVARAVSADPHARVRAVRIAYLEAQLRAGGPLGQVTADVTVRSDPRGVRVDIEVEALVLTVNAARKRRRL